MTIDDLVRENIKKLVPYQSARNIGGNGDIWLNANESPDCSNFQFSSKTLNRYPECQPLELISAYSLYVKLHVDNILITRGSDEAIELLIKTFCEPNYDKIVFCPPTYDMYGVSSAIVGVESIKIPLLNDFQLDINTIIKYVGDFKLIYICNPNNPTGNLMNYKDLIYLLELTINKSLVIIDEAYIEFCSKNSMKKLLFKYSNLVILRTLSKAFSLAGLRCGFVLSNPKIIKALLKVINPYPIASPIASIAVQSLSKFNVSMMKKRILKLNLNRLWLVSKLKKISVVKKIFCSVANYILVEFYNSDHVFQELLKNKIIVRDQNTKLNLKNCIRISVGNRFECSKLIQVIQKLEHLYEIK